MDVEVSGKKGFYGIKPVSRKGRAWVKRNLSIGERTVSDGVTWCEGSRNARAIVAGLVKDGLKVEVNGMPGPEALQS